VDFFILPLYLTDKFSLLLKIACAFFTSKKTIVLHSSILITKLIKIIKIDYFSPINLTIRHRKIVASSTA